MEKKKNFKAWPKGRPKSINYPSIPVYQFLNSTAARFPDRVAIRFAGMELTYQELLNLSHKFAHALKARGVKKGDRVAIHLPNCPQFAIAYYGLLKLGAILVPCSPLMVEKELADQLNDAGATVLLTLDLLFGTVEKILDQTTIKNVIVTSLADVYPPVALSIKLLRKVQINKGEDFLSLLEEGSTDPINEKIDPKKDLVHLAYTGGTTGVSKGVMLTHFNVVANVIQVNHWLSGGDVSYQDGILKPDRTLLEKEMPNVPQALSEGATALVVVPWFHGMGTIGYLNNMVYGACTMIVSPRFDPVDYIRSVEKYKADMLGGAPQLYIPLVQNPEFDKTDLSGIKLAVSGAAPLPGPIMKQMLNRFSGVVCEAYGLTEITMACLLNPPMKDSIRFGSVGIPPADTYIKVIDLVTGEILAPEKEGEICVLGPQCMQGYWKKPEETDQVLIDGWVHSGDIGYEDKDGYFYITDRKKDMIIYKGYNVYPKQLEEALYEHPAVANCAVLGKKDEKGGEIPVAFVQRKPNTDPSPEEIMEFVNSKVAAYKHVREVRFIDEIPVSAAGKVLKRELKKLIQE